MTKEKRKERIIIVSSNCKATFTYQVNQCLKEGWKLYGDPFPSGKCIVQMLVIKE